MIQKLYKIYVDKGNTQDDPIFDVFLDKEEAIENLEILGDGYYLMVPLKTLSETQRERQHQ